MKQTEIIELIGLLSTDVKLLAFFEKYGLKKPPKTVNSNSCGIAIRHKDYQIDFDFDYDIINEAFYPPVSPKNNDYYFIAYLKAVYFYLPKKNDTRTNDFWDITPNPKGEFEQFENYFGKIDNGYFKKTYSELINIVAQYEIKKNKCEYVSFIIKQEREIISSDFFDQNNEYNLWPEAYTFLIKWLFDNRFLNISDKIYNHGLEPSHQVILEFVQSNLKNKLWQNQLKEVPNLYQFLNAIRSNNKIWKDENKDQVVFYQNNLFLIATGNFEQYNKLFYEDIDKADELCKSARFTPETAQIYLNLLTDRFAIFPIIRDLKINN
ncbi:hypothetical protein GCM10022386_03330 [Flavobacterium cheonhonense]|uniref:Uncharacterized protein n=1 Tax=Flavobacterium cheonhonense TaxID=706185 RepID=A0ABP7TB01_9FLAO|nr:hypothetical protein [Flavobacterium cheonhonense]